jgi:hypothetical protein
MKNKRLHLLLLLFVFPFCVEAAEIFVSTSGNDRNAGTRSQPLATVAMALRKARDLRRLNDSSIKDGIKIIIAGGTYQFTEPLFIRPEDLGTASSPTIIESAAGEIPVFSGGVQIRGWRKSTGRIWEAQTSLNDFRQLWVNGAKAIRAKEFDGDSMGRILSWDRVNETCWIPLMKNLSFSPGMEMVIHQWWAIAILRISSIERKGDSALLRFMQPESRVQSEHPWPAPWISKETGNSAFYLVNAMQFLDEPGEWFFDKKNQKVYYYPSDGENMSNATVIAPSLETLVKIEGTADHPVSHIHFKGISFQHTGWLRPSQQGHVPHQAGMYMLDAYSLKTPGTADKAALENQAWVGRPAAAVQATNTTNTSFEDCRFEHMASTALDYQKGNHDGVINGNLFKDIGGSAILAGVFSDEATEVHLPYNPSDEREITSNLRISNNLITNVANEDWGCVGIGAGYVRNIDISHNEICDISYTGISLGWGWTRTVNAMRNNRVYANHIHHYAKHLYDVAAVYTLSAQPGTIISENYIDSIYVAPYAHIPSHWFYLYTDEGTSNVTVKNNWCPAEKFLQNANGPGNTWQNNGPQVADSIRQRAGLLPQYEYLQKQKVITPAWPVNHYTGNKQAIIEVIAYNNDKTLLPFLQSLASDKDSVYKWQDHYVFFANDDRAQIIASRIRERFPGNGINLYDNIFYEFNRSRCSNDFAASWDNIILTANLAANRQLEKEYMDHHATQFEKWPEITRGFCNASFQQLLLYRSGFQLMLVISIPKGQSLDALNPKTTENNSRVNDWNALMKKYQQGIAGTKPGETWVLFQPVPSKNNK